MRISRHHRSLSSALAIIGEWLQTEARFLA
jgi:hypothetical protein